MRVLGALLVLQLLVLAAHGLTRDPRAGQDRRYHPSAKPNRNIDNLNPDELDAAYWMSEAQVALRARLNVAENLHVAKNVIMFLGDGMSVTTLAAARTLMGQRANRTGEEAALAFETFPVVGLAKTYCVDNQVADSACTATAYLCGIKNNYGTVGVDGRVQRRDCDASVDNSTHVSSIASWALWDGKDAGIVTTTRITHASPSGTFAHSANRDWENDAAVDASGANPEVCRDIAYQLVHGFPGNQFKVIFGGGRRNFKIQNPEDTSGNYGLRLERDLIEEWQENKRSRNVNYRYVSDLGELRTVDIENTDYLMGLFADNHLPYNLEANATTDPTLEELTDIAIKMLRKNDRGYFLFVEGGRIDHGHHDNRVHLALDETIEFSKAVQRAIELTSEQDTLIVITSDHSHVMAFNGYSHRGNDILGPVDDRDTHGVPYMTLSYTNGPGFRPHTVAGVRPDVTLEPTYGNVNWRSHSDAPRNSESHGGEDVAVFARGPQQHVFTGLYEQSQLPHLMGYAACLGPGLHAPACSSAPARTGFALLMIATALVTIFFTSLRTEYI